LAWNRDGTGGRNIHGIDNLQRVCRKKIRAFFHPCVAGMAPGSASAYASDPRAPTRASPRRVICPTASGFRRSHESGAREIEANCISKHGDSSVARLVRLHDTPPGQRRQNAFMAIRSTIVRETSDLLRFERDALRGTFDASGTTERGFSHDTCSNERLVRRGSRAARVCQSLSTPTIHEAHRSRGCAASGVWNRCTVRVALVQRSLEASPHMSCANPVVGAFALAMGIFAPQGAAPFDACVLRGRKVGQTATH